MHGTNVNEKKLTKRQRANILRKTARFFEENPTRWIIGALGIDSNYDTGSYCAVGGIYKHQENRDRNNSPYGIANSIMPQHVWLNKLHGVNDLFVYNDSKANGVKDVIKVLRAAARYLEHGGN